MAITTYAELQSAIANWLNRDDLTAVIPDFITFAEADIQRRLRHVEMEKRDTVSASTQYTALPDDFLQAIRVSLDGDNNLEPMSANEMQDERDRYSDTSGTPAYYTITAGQLELWPTPDAAKTVNLYYYRTLPALTDSNTTNWLLTEAPDLYVYASLVHSAPFLADDARTQTWAALYESTLDKVQQGSDNKKWGGGALRLRKPR